MEYRSYHCPSLIKLRYKTVTTATQHNREIGRVGEREREREGGREGGSGGRVGGRVGGRERGGGEGRVKRGTYLQKEDTDTLSQRPKLFLVGMIPMQYLGEKEQVYLQSLVKKGMHLTAFPAAER